MAATLEAPVFAPTLPQPETVVELHKPPLTAAANGDWAEPSPKAHKTDSSPVRRLGDLAGRRKRLAVLLFHAEDDRPSHEQIRALLSLPNRSLVSHHVDRLVKEGLLARSDQRKTPEVTALGRVVLAYAEAARSEEPLWETILRDAFGFSRLRAAEQAVREAAARLDREYSRTSAGAVRRSGPEKGQLERKATGHNILRALQKCSTWEEAAQECGVTRRSLRERVVKLLAHARTQ